MGKCSNMHGSHPLGNARPKHPMGETPMPHPLAQGQRPQGPARGGPPQNVSAPTASMPTPFPPETADQNEP